MFSVVAALLVTGLIVICVVMLVKRSKRRQYSSIDADTDEEKVPEMENAFVSAAEQGTTSFLAPEHHDARTSLESVNIH